MINFFNKYFPTKEERVDQMVDAIKDVGTAYQQPESTFNDDGYTIGYADGYTVMKLKSGYTTMTLRMLPKDTHRLIRLLEATLEDDELQENEIDE